MAAEHLSRIADNVRIVRERIAAACARVNRSSNDVRLIAVTKTETPDALPALAAVGITEYGENRVDHLDRMRAGAPENAAFHYIGRVQSRQLPAIAATCAALHSLCDEDHIMKLGRACIALDRRLPVFFQVNVADDDAKAGMRPEQIQQRLDLARSQPSLEVVGLMTMAPLDAHGGQASDTLIHRCFADLRKLAEYHHLPRLSMGMSHDFEIAIEEGATDVRIGRRLFV